MTNDIYQRVVDILVDVLMIEDPDRVTPDSHLIKDLGAESINFAEITVAVEDEFAVRVDGSSLQRAATVQSLAEYVEELQAANPA